MDEETREQIVEMLTRAGMMAEDLSLVALAAAMKSDDGLSLTVQEAERRLHGIAELIRHAGILREGR